MASYDHRDFMRDHFGPDAFFPQHPLSMSMPEASSGLSISLPTTTSFQLGSPTYSNNCCTPRTIAPHPSHMLTAPAQGYHPGGTYTITGHPASARGRSCSGASTVSADFSVASQEATPRSPFSFNEPSSQFRATYDDQVTHAGGIAFNSQEKSSMPQENQGPVPEQGGDGTISSNNKAVADNRTFCPHSDCLDEDGRPKKFFSRKADVTRHIKSRHDIKYIDCPKKNCERKGSQGFTRRDHLTEHLRGFHMEKIAKRQIANTKAKRGEKHVSEDSNGSNSSSEGLTPPEHVEDNSYFASGQQSTAEQVDQGIKQEPSQSSDEEGEDIFSMYEDYLPKRPKRSKNPAQKRKSKAKATQNHLTPTPRRPSNLQPHHSAPDGTAQVVPQGLTFQPEFATSRMMPDSPIYSTHHQQHQHQHQHQVYTTSNMMAPLYIVDSGMDSFYDHTSMAQVYDSLPAQAIDQYHQVESLDESHFQSMQE